MFLEQTSLPGFSIALANKKRKAVGTIGEHNAAYMLQKSGYQVSKSKPLHGDLRAIETDTGQIFYVEIKTARQGRDGKWRFLLHKQDKYGQTNHRNTDVIILLATTDSGRMIPFVIPTPLLAHKHHAVITSHPETYSGWLSQYRVNGAIKL